MRILPTIGITLCSLMPLAGALCEEPHPTRTPATHLALTGLYSDFATKAITPGNLMYSPQYPLWSDGAGKKRWIYLPPKRTIDATRVDDWVFPIGTKLWKEFSFGKRVETRYLEKVAKGVWTFATYVWNEDVSDAVLVPDRGLPNNYEIAPGVRHDIPGVIDCKACHEGQGRDVVLGFNALQLSPDRDANAPNAEPVTPEMINLKDLVIQGRVAHLPSRFVKEPPVIAAALPRARAALGYLHANCGGCHNSTDPLASVGMILKRSLEGTSQSAQLETVIGHKSKYQIPELASDSSYRILAGDPLRSTIVYRMGSRNPARQMPPLGTKIVDKKALALITLWIQEDLASSSEKEH